MDSSFQRGQFAQQPGGGAAVAGGDIHQPAAVAETSVEWPEAGQSLPEQGGGARTVLMPNTYTFLLPASLAGLWHDIEVKDTREFLANGQLNPTFNRLIKRKQLKFDRNNPLIVVGGPHDGEPMLAQFSSAPRPRSFEKNASKDPKTPWISDLSYLLDISLNDKSRPADPVVLVATINRYAGKTIRLQTGLSAFCNPERVRYLRVVIDLAAYQASGGKTGVDDITDPTGRKGCGRRYRTSDFKIEGGYNREVGCDCGTPTPEEAAKGVQPATVVLRGFEQVERFLPPLGQ